MHITKLQPGYAPASAPPLRQRDAVAEQGGRSPDARVQLSSAARELARQYSLEGLSPERIGMLRQQIARGAYPEPPAIEELAWRLIEMGLV